ncbi:MAG: grasp-with-spasm system ATP-grasp peptide maturase [Tannerella sp.]|jgi:ATP-GRASP peptide maturase of grasp-with-spasm system|nr:grasp-with-spasm system ATP-grasp peptide maturase [Tannerella sp.]
MILILSEEKDSVTDAVCNWLNHCQFPFIRINNEAIEEYEAFILFDSNEQKILLLNEKNVDCFDIHKTWFRRGYLHFKSKKRRLDLDGIAMACMNQHLDNEHNTLENFLYYILKGKEHINEPSAYNANKLIVLHEARKIGLLTPPTLVTRNSNAIKDFIERKNACITKNIQDIIQLHFENGGFTSQATQKVGREEIADHGYWYSLFQQEIKKKYELRIFFFIDKFYAAAIFSQSNENSVADFRTVSFNTDTANRMVPFKLPKAIRQKLIKLMKNVNMQSGSIDMIVDLNDNYYFLEVNPVGQFGFVSKICNYYIEKEIAKYLGK